MLVIRFPAIVAALCSAGLLGLESFLCCGRGVFQHDFVEAGQTDIQGGQIVIVTNQLFNFMGGFAAIEACLRREYLGTK